MSVSVPVESVENKILLIRGIKVMLDKDLARLYGVSTRRLNEQVRRNLKRFPDDFMFKLSKNEKDEVVAICDHLKDLKFSYQLPYAFTEQGIAMLSGVLHSERAVCVNIAIMRAFVKLRQFLAANNDISEKLNGLERKTKKHDDDILVIFEAIRQLMAPPPEKPKPRIGFHP
jgi:hypothetical protein